MIIPYPWMCNEQIEWYKLFEQTMMEFINDIYLDYDLYISLGTSRQLNNSYYSMIETFELANKYLSEIQQYVKWVEQTYPGITHKKIVDVVKQIYINIQPRLLNTYALYSKLHNAYMQSLSSVALPPAMPLALPFVPEQEEFCII